ncbi:MAG: hypothetical protein HQ567_16990 [Candidatus Nealsonbacteria bacterium]|nr:hypothetical protein [Candidatus Nealsonbacteria bacterium]
MRNCKTASLEELKIISRFESLRKILSSEEYADHLDKPLAYWALPTDRRLPLAFLSRSLRDLFASPLSELSSTPGIGQKKMTAFVELLARAADTDPAELPIDAANFPEEDAATLANGRQSEGNGFDPTSISEVVWSHWRSSVIEHSLGDEALGKFAPSLRHMTRVIWNKPLRAYTQYSLDEIRNLKTHGEKRVRAILGVFYSVHTLTAEMGAQDHLIVRIVPKTIDRVEQWIDMVLQQPGIPSEDEIFEQFISPLLGQVRTDATVQIANLAENRLGIGSPITSVRQAARTMGLTRARVYQLLNEINDIMAVRWPNGRHQVYELLDKFNSESATMENPPSLKQYCAAVELFYPGSRRGAAGPLEQAFPVVAESTLIAEAEAVA